MNQEPREPVDPGLERSLRRYYADTALRPVPVGLAGRVRGGFERPARRGMSLATLAAAAAVVVLLAAVVGSPGLVGRGDERPSGGPLVSPTGAAPTRSVSFDARGIPTTIDGEPVLTGADIGRHVTAATDDTPFLIGGTVESVAIFCAMIPAYPSPNPLLQPCNGLQIDGYRLVWSPSSSSARGIDLSGPMILRVHVHDPGAASCPTTQRADCEQAIVVDERIFLSTTTGTGRDVEGLPTAIEGEPVLVGGDIDARVATIADGSSFLVGGFVHRSATVCPRAVLQPPVNPLLPECPMDLQLEGGRTLVDEHSSLAGFGDGPMVLRVHAHDRRATACPAGVRDRCERLLFVDAVAYQGSLRLPVAQP